MLPPTTLDVVCWCCPPTWWDQWSCPTHSTWFQVVICVCVLLVLPPTALDVQPVAAEPYVERQCEISELALLIPLGYNLLLVLLTSILAFLTRQLPDNYNESWYVHQLSCYTIFSIKKLVHKKFFWSCWWSFNVYCILGLAYLTLKGQRSKIKFLFLHVGGHGGQVRKKKLTFDLWPFKLK